MVCKWVALKCLIVINNALFVLIYWSGFTEVLNRSCLLKNKIYVLCELKNKGFSLPQGLLGNAVLFATWRINGGNNPSDWLRDWFPIDVRCCCCGRYGNLCMDGLIKNKWSVYPCSLCWYDGGGLRGTNWVHRNGGLHTMRGLCVHVRERRGM